ncbi:hypothetical protein [Ekhidna sp.]|uniref:hypothetical protein n=1 Tax=Ekhidna sp. TaxID=2608089 RepID=UPI003297CCB5
MNPAKYFNVALLFLAFHQMFAQTNVQEMESFLQRSVTEVDSATLTQNIRQFLYLNSDNGVPKWFDGSIVLKSGYQLNGIKLKFNVFDNSVYLKANNKHFKASNSTISGFIIDGADGELQFRKGFGLPYEGIVEVTTSLRHQEILTYLKDYPDFESISIRLLSIEKRARNHKLSIELETKSSQAIFKLKNYLIKHDAIANVDSEYLIPELNENTYVEVLFEHESFTVVKHHFKKVAQIGSVSLSQHKSIFMFDEKDYYIASNKKILTEFLFNKASIKKAFYASQFDNYPKLRKVGSEVKFMKWLNQNLD